MRGQIELWREYTPDRHVLEEVIFGALLERGDMRRLLFVGCDWYTRRYPEIFAAREFWTIDMQPDKARYGSRRHVVGNLTQLREHFEAGSLDAVICVGVLGWGLDGHEETERALDGCFECLRPGGLLILSWNEAGAHRATPLGALSSLRRFEPCTLPGFPAATYPTFSDLGSVFGFYRRPGTVEPTSA